MLVVVRAFVEAVQPKYRPARGSCDWGLGVGCVDLVCGQSRCAGRFRPSVRSHILSALYPLYIYYEHEWLRAR